MTGESTLLLRLAGPQQAWGSHSRFAVRATEHAPTRSGVIGLLAAALGRDRSDSLEEFTQLRFGVRIDQPGTVERDFQTARTHDGKKSMPLSQRYYLADAIFLAGISTSDTERLEVYQEALRKPQYPLFLGRRAFPPASPIQTWLVPQPLREALTAAPWLASERHRRAHSDQEKHLDILVDAEPGEPVEMTLADIPVSFDPRRRRHEWRDVAKIRATTAGALPLHDPMRLVRNEEV